MYIHRNLYSGMSTLGEVEGLRLAMNFEIFVRVQCLTSVLLSVFSIFFENNSQFPISTRCDNGMARDGLVRHLHGDLSFPNSSPFARMLDICISYRSLQDARRVHARILKTRFSSEVFIQNRFIDAYGKCGSLEDARKLFDRMAERNAFSWNAMLTALTKCGYLHDAAQLFRLVPQPDQCSWNSMLSGFAQYDFFKEAIGYFIGMIRTGIYPNEYSFGSALCACTGLMNVKLCAQVHSLALKSTHSCDVYTSSALIDMYSKCGVVDAAQKVFDAMEGRNVVSWNSLISCYEQNGPQCKALQIFLRMMDSGFEPDEVTLASVVSACASVPAVEEGRQIHACVVKFDKFRSDLILNNALVDMYAKCSRIKEARLIFDRLEHKNVISKTTMVSGYARAASVEDAKFMFMEMIEKNVISWNALIAGYTQNGENEESLRLFRLLKREPVIPTHYTFGNVLNACANLADLQLGRQVHVHVLKHGFRFQSGPEPDIFVGNSLIDMYVKCGSIEDGNLVFTYMIDRDKVSWNAMIVGFAQNGNGGGALELLKKMLESGEKPDHVTMLGVLCACSHAGLVEEGRRFFISMTEDYGLMPLKDHYTCMVDLLGRGGRHREAEHLIEMMPMPPDAVVWSSLLASCRTHGNIEVGKRVAGMLMQSDPGTSGSYVLISNMYAELGKWRDVVKVRKLMRQRGVTKQPGCSWIQVQTQVHVFMVKDSSHPRKKEIYQTLQMLSEQMKRARYTPYAGGIDDFEVIDSLVLTSHNHQEVALFC